MDGGLPSGHWRAGNRCLADIGQAAPSVPAPSTLPLASVGHGGLGLAALEVVRALADVRGSLASGDGQERRESRRLSDEGSRTRGLPGAGGDAALLGRDPYARARGASGRAGGPGVSTLPSRRGQGGDRRLGA